VHYRIALPLMNPTEGKTATLRVVKDDKVVHIYFSIPRDQLRAAMDTYRASTQPTTQP